MIASKIFAFEIIEHNEFDKDAVLAAIEMWYKESLDFDYGRPDSLNSLTRNFTQMVWRDSTKLGLGVARSDSRSIFF